MQRARGGQRVARGALVRGDGRRAVDAGTRTKVDVGARARAVDLAPVVTATGPVVRLHDARDAVVELHDPVPGVVPRLAVDSCRSRARGLVAAGVALLQMTA